MLCKLPNFLREATNWSRLDGHLNGRGFIPSKVWGSGFWLEKPRNLANELYKMLSSTKQVESDASFILMALFEFCELLDDLESSFDLYGWLSSI